VTGAGGCGSGCVRRTAADRLFSHTPPGAPPWLAHGEVSFAGRLDRARLRAALDAVDRRHPLLRARRCGRHEDHWRVDPGVRSPLDVTDGDDRRPLAERRAALRARPVDLRSGGPLVVHLARTDGGDHLVAVGHHALVDGVALFRVLADLGRAYAGHELGIDEGWRRDRHVDVAGVDPARAGAVARVVRHRTRATAVRLAGDGGRAGEGPAGGGTGALVVPLDLGPLAAEPVATRAGRLLLAIAGVARRWNRDRGAATDPVVIGLAVNLRPHARWTASVGNASVVWPVLVPPEDAGEGPWPGVAGQVAEVRLGRRSGSVRGFLAALADRPTLPVWARRGMSGTTLLSAVAHLGGIVDFGGDAPAVSGVWGTPPATPAAGIAFGACLDEGHAWLSARYLGHRLSPAAAHRLTAEIARDVTGA
jgi:hypothetical protein